jgi:hypothetical protein
MFGISTITLVARGLIAIWCYRVSGATCPRDHRAQPREKLLRLFYTQPPVIAHETREDLVKIALLLRLADEQV